MGGQGGASRAVSTHLRGTGLSADECEHLLVGGNRLGVVADFHAQVGSAQRRRDLWLDQVGLPRAGDAIGRLVSTT